MSAPRPVVPLVLLAAGSAVAHAQQSPGATGAVPGVRWESALSAEALGWSSRDLAEVRKTVESTGSAAFMIVTRGKVVAAWGDTSKTFLTHSIRKSFLSALMGIAVGGGKLDTGATLAALGIDEKKTPLTSAERQARVADLLRARSGVYLAAAGEVESMRTERPTRGSHPAGTHWYYNNWDFNALGTIYRRSTGEDIFRAIDTRIANPIGMQDFRAPEGEYYLEDPSEHPGFIFRISARDLARFGVLYLNRGRWGERVVIPESWVDASVRSYSVTSGVQRSAATGSGYGFMWWIQTDAAAHPEFRIPDGTFTAAGAGGQMLTVIPQIETVIVSLTNTDQGVDSIRSIQWDSLLLMILAARLR
jgi:CubicO group peptidase (beta-lactamase class C family)